MRFWDRLNNTWGFHMHWLRRESGDFRHPSRQCPGQELGTLLSLHPFVLNSWRTAFCSTTCCPCGSLPTWIRWWATCRSRAKTASTWTSTSQQKTVSQLYPSHIALVFLFAPPLFCEHVYQWLALPVILQIYWLNLFEITQLCGTVWIYMARWRAGSGRERLY